MGSSVAGAAGLNGFTTWVQTAVKGAQILSTNISGGDTNYGVTNWTGGAGGNQNPNLWSWRLVLQADPAGGPIRYRYDGAAPSGTQGLILTGGDSAVIEGWDNIRRFQFASNAVTAGTLIVSAERPNP